MELVMLPGMDGTGDLFAKVLCELGCEANVLALPQEGSQDYQTLAKKISEELPRNDFILLAESFSGGVAYELAKSKLPTLKGIIFVASFLSSPRKKLSAIASKMPLSLLVCLPFSSLVIRYFFLGTSVPSTEVLRFKKIIREVPVSVLKQRLKVITNAKIGAIELNTPVVYLAAKNDRLVPITKKNDFSRVFTDVYFMEIEGPHFTLQSEPKSAAIKIREAIGFISERTQQ